MKKAGIMILALDKLKVKPEGNKYHKEGHIMLKGETFMKRKFRRISTITINLKH